MSKFIYVGAEPSNELESWRLKLINDPIVGSLQSMAVVGFPKQEEYSSFTGYYNMGAIEKASAANTIQFDAIDDFIKANIGRYRAMDVDETGAGYDDHFFESGDGENHDSENWLFEPESDDE